MFCRGVEQASVIAKARGLQGLRLRAESLGVGLGLLRRSVGFTVSAFRSGVEGLGLRVRIFPGVGIGLPGSLLECRGSKLHQSRKFLLLAKIQGFRV